MINYIKPQELLSSDQFVREPVDNVTKDILDNPSKQIILTGGRGIGKTTILHNLESRTIGTRNPVIYTQFDSVISFSEKTNELFNESFFEHYYEICFSYKLLNYIKKRYPLFYYKNMKDIEIFLNEKEKELHNFFKSFYIRKISKRSYIETKGILAEIIRRLKEILNISSLNIALDRFDWTNGKSEYIQHLLSKYFYLFDKTIITTDDESLNSEDKEGLLEAKGYSFMTPEYNQNLEVIKLIIRKRIEASKEVNRFNIDILTDDIYSELIEKTNGNISLMLTIINKVNDLILWYGENEPINSLIEEATSEEISKTLELKNMTKQPKLYL